jgi:simple sugar transport system permease protein
MAQTTQTSPAPSSSTPTPEAGLQASASGLESVLSFLARYREASIAVVAILIVIYFESQSQTFLTFSELSVVLRDTGSIGMMAAAMVFVMTTGEIDLSVGATFGLCPYVMSLLATYWLLPLWLSAVLAIALGAGVGFVNSIITVKTRVPSLITTLGTFFLLEGVVVTIAHSQPIVTPVQEPFNVIFGEDRYSPTDAMLSWHGLTAFTPFLWPLAVVLILTILLNRTKFGLHVVATGSNLVGAREIGVRTDRMKIYSFMILGAVVAFAGIISAVEFNSTDPDVGTSTLTLQTIAAAVIGGTSLAGGSGTTIGALIGAFVISALQNGLVLIGAQATESDIFLGLAIVAAMILNVQVGNVRTRRRV